MNFRSRAVAACILAVAAAGCGTVTASSSPGGAQTTTGPPVHPTASATAAKQSQAPGIVNASTGAPSSCQHPAGDVLTLAGNGKAYCI